MTKIFGGGRGYAQILRVNGSVERLTEGLTDDQKRVFSLNNTVIELRIHEQFQDSQLNELLYVIIVIVFYATALMTLIITQIKRQRREGTEVDYYDEYLQRNSEVKRTCQTATSIVSRQTSGGGNAASGTKAKKPPPKALATAAFAAAAAGTLLGKTPEIPADDVGVDATLLAEATAGYGADGLMTCGPGGVGLGQAGLPDWSLLQAGGCPNVGIAIPGGFSTHGSPRPSRDRSPMLESIPDEEF